MGYIDLSNTAGEVVATIPVCEECKNKIVAGQIERDEQLELPLEGLDTQGPVV